MVFQILICSGLSIENKAGGWWLVVLPSCFRGDKGWNEGGDMIFPPNVVPAQAFINMVAHLGSERRCVQRKPIASPPVLNSVI